MTRLGGRRATVAAVLLVGASIVLAACSAGDGGGAPESRPAPSQEAYSYLRDEGFGCRWLTVRAEGSPERRTCTWVADTEAQRERGLMGVTDPDLGGPGAMVFDFDRPTTGGFWMKDTLLPLTVVWVGPDGRVLGSTDMTPCPAGSTCPVYPPPGPYTMAIEVARGRAAGFGLVPGAIVVLGDPCEVVPR